MRREKEVWKEVRDESKVAGKRKDVLDEREGIRRERELS